MVQPGMDDSGLVRGLGAVGGALYQYGDLRRQIQQERSRALLENIDRQFREREFEAQRKDAERRFQAGQDTEAQRRKEWQETYNQNERKLSSLDTSRRTPKSLKQAAVYRYLDGQMSWDDLEQFLDQETTNQGDIARPGGGGSVQERIGGLTTGQFLNETQEAQKRQLGSVLADAGVSNISGLDPVNDPKNALAAGIPQLRSSLESQSERLRPFREKYKYFSSPEFLGHLTNNPDSQRVYMGKEFSPRTAANQNISLARNFVQSQPDTNRTADTSNYQNLPPNMANANRQLDSMDAERQALREAPMNEARAKLQYVQQWVAKNDSLWKQRTPAQREQLISYYVNNPDRMK